MRSSTQVHVMKVLVADNNQHMLDHLSDLLEKEGLETIKADSGTKALELYEQDKPSFICLDIMMEDLSGYDVCRKIREKDNDTPIIFISSKSDTIDKVVGLEIGADDYIVKPFDIKEVNARIRAITRRCISQNNTGTDDKDANSFKIADIEVFPKELLARRDGQSIDLNLRDIKILSLLHKKKNQVVDRNLLLDMCWGRHIMPESRTVDWHISQLRKTIEINPQEPAIILTVHGVGYRYIEA